MKKKTIKLGLLALVGLSVLATSCRKKGCTDETAFNYNEEAKKDDGTCTYNNAATIKFTQSFNNADVTVADFNDIKYTNAKGTEMSISRLRYMISDVTFYKADGDSIEIDMYHLIDVTDAATLTHVLAEKLDPIAYTGIAFNFGFTPEDNIDGEYIDLNAAGWSWPDPLEGGYHQMQLEGQFVDSAGADKTYAYHNGSKTKQMMTTETPVPNYFHVRLDQTIDLTTDRSIEIDMQIDQWFESPNLWDLDMLNSSLMGNKAAQLMMTANGSTVFRLGEVN